MNEKPSLFASFWAMPKRRPAAGALTRYKSAKACRRMKTLGANQALKRALKYYHGVLAWW